MRSYVSATLVKTPATRWVFSASVTVWKPKCVSRSAVLEIGEVEAALLGGCCCDDDGGGGGGGGDNEELVVEKDRGDDDGDDDETEDTRIVLSKFVVV